MILMFGDTHGNFGHVLPHVQAEKPAAIIFLGDLQAQQPLEKELADVMSLTEVYWIHGNHDTDSRADYDNLFNSALADRNLHGKVTEIDGLRIAGLGGVFRESVWYPRNDPEAVPHYETYDAFIKAELDAERWKEYRRLKAAGAEPNGLPSPALQGKALTHKSTIFYEDWLNLYGQRADILVTHEAPSCHPYGFIALDVLAQSMRVKYSFHGHMHDRLNYSEHHERLGFSAHGVGFCGVTNQHGKMVKAGEFDSHYERLHQQHKRSRD
jgi:predicted phosphodiesterase